MGETENPRVALDAPDLPTQAAAARDLARMGVWDDLDRLLAVAASHKRLGMRLSAVGAVADIVHREVTMAAARGEPGLPADQESRLLAWVSEQDPGGNPSLLMLLSHLRDDRALERLVRLLFDPRGDVRAGAVVALRRAALSHVDVDGVRYHDVVSRVLLERRLSPDARTELVRLCGEVGWVDLRGTLAALASGSAPGREAVDEAVRRLDQRFEADAWGGVYESDGLDVLEQDERPRPASLLLVHGGAFALDQGLSNPFLIAGARWSSPEGPARLVWAPRLGHADRPPAIQVRGRTWRRVEGKALVDALDADRWSVDPHARPATGAFFKALAEEEGAGADRARAIALCLEGRWGEARLALLEMVEGKRQKIDIYPWLARACERVGDPGGARAAWLTYLEKAPKRAVARAEAEERIGELTPAGDPGDSQ